MQLFENVLYPFPNENQPALAIPKKNLAAATAQEKTSLVGPEQGQ